jgi:hypothetical protein
MQSASLRENAAEAVRARIGHSEAIDDESAARVRAEQADLSSFPN